MDAYFSADIETDGPIPGPYSMLSCALVYAGSFDGKIFHRPSAYNRTIYREVKPISSNYEDEALRVNGLDRNSILDTGQSPHDAMNELSAWISKEAGSATPILVAYPLSFDWSWLYWYFTRFSRNGSPFEYSRCYDIKTAFAVKANIPIGEAGRSRLPAALRSQRTHTHHALDDAIEQAEIFANIFEWDSANE